MSTGAIDILRNDWVWKTHSQFGSFNGYLLEGLSSLLFVGRTSQFLALSIGLLECYSDIATRFPQSKQAAILKTEQREGCNVFNCLVWEVLDHHFHPIPFIRRELLYLAHIQGEET